MRVGYIDLEHALVTLPAAEHAGWHAATNAPNLATLHSAWTYGIIAAFVDTLIFGCWLLVRHSGQ